MSSNKLQILVTGGTGFIGSPLVSMLQQQGHSVRVLTRQKSLKQQQPGNVRYINSLDEVNDDEHIDAIINLAGESLAESRWTDQQKKKLVNSRLHTTRDLFACAQRLQHKPDVLINASAIGYYGPQGDTRLDESAATVDCFSHKLCKQWEAAAQEFETLDMRVCRLRFGVVFGPGGGAFSELRRSFDFGVASQFGDGAQWMSWVHRDDVVGVIMYALQHADMDGAINTTAPEPVTNADFCKTMRANKRTLIKLKLPPFVMRTLVGEMAEELLLTGQRVVPKKLTDAGYSFKYPNLQSALDDLLN